MSDTPRTDAFAESWHLAKGLADNGRTYGWGTLSDAVDEMRKFERELAAVKAAHADAIEQWSRAEGELKALRSATQESEYICKCGIRVVPHRCQTGTDF